MNERNDLPNPSAITQLRREWGGFAFAASLLTLGLFLALRQGWRPGEAWGWLAASATLLVYQFVYLWRHLADNRLSVDSPLFPSLGLANAITIARSILSAGLAGFLLAPWPGGVLSWLPGLLYLVAAVLDYLDGYAARVTGRTTLLGEVLDMQWDSTGVLFGSLLAVRYGQAPLPYALVGLARYLFLFGLWLRVRQGLPVYDLPPSRYRRALAGTQMGFIVAILLPVFSPPVTQLAALIFMLPFLVAFLRDWLSVSGKIAPSELEAEQSGVWGWSAVRVAVPLAARGLVLALLVLVVLDRPGLLDFMAGRLPSSMVALLAASALAIPLLLLGVAGRLTALAVLLMSGFALQISPFDGRFWLILLLSTVLFMTGTGRFSLWKPEDWLIYHRAGERSH